MTPKLVVGLPTRVYAPGIAFSTLTAELIATTRDIQIVEFLSPIETSVVEARIKIVTAALELYRQGHATHLWSLDDDMVPPTAVVQRGHRFGVAERLLAQNKPFVSALAFDQLARPVAIAKGGQNRRILRVPETGLIEVGRTGLACTMINIAVLDAVAKKYGNVFDDPFARHEESEDYRFCRRLEEMKIPMFVDCGIVCGHMKFQQVNYSTYRTQWTEEVIQAAEQTDQTAVIGSFGALEILHDDGVQR